MILEAQAACLILDFLFYSCLDLVISDSTAIGFILHTEWIVSNSACLFLPLAGGVLPPVLLFDTVEDSWHFTTFESLHGTA